MLDALLSLEVVDSPLLVALNVLAGALLVVLLARRRRRWPMVAAVALVSGVLLGALTVAVVTVTDVFDGPLSAVTTAWILAAFGGWALALVNLPRAPWWRRIVAGIGVVVFVLVATLGVNAGYGFDRTIGSMLGVVVEKPIDLPPVTTGAASADASVPAYRRWTPPNTLPASRTGTVRIPNPASGFDARPAGLYLPPAALVPDAPALPLVVMLMGQPGNPDPTIIARVLDRFAAAHDGLAPIVVVADQLGDPDRDPMCLDTAEYGAAETYLSVDVVGWARSHLNVLAEPEETTIAGFSNGGQCAVSLLAAHPDVWGNLVDVSGVLFPGQEHEAETLAEVFAGDEAAYDAVKPSSLLAARGPDGFAGTVGIFAVGADDPLFPGATRTLADDAERAGMSVTFREIAGAGHDARAVEGGLTAAFEVLYPRLGLSAP